MKDANLEIGLFAETPRAAIMMDMLDAHQKQARQRRQKADALMQAQQSEDGQQEKALYLGCECSLRVVV